MRIVLCYPLERRHIEQIATAAPEAEIVDAGQQRVAEELFEADVYCGHAKVPIDWEGVVRRGRLRWIQSSAAGMDHCVVPPVIRSDLVVTSASGVLADQVAEHAIALLTGWFRGMPVFYEAQRKREFVRRPTQDLTGRTVGIVGLGGVGRRLAQTLRPFRTRILATDVYPIDKPEEVDELLPAERLEEMLAAVDVVVLTLPLNESTREMFDARLLARIKPRALFANMARGPLVVEDDLVAALESGHLAGAVMDVAATEPLPKESRLWDQENVIITPHVAGQSVRRIDNMTRLFCENIRRWKAGRPMINRLTDLALGFPVRGDVPLWCDLEP